MSEATSRAIVPDKNRRILVNCREATRLLSQSMDARLPWHRRLAIRLHLLYCVWCRRYAAQLQFLRRAMGQMAASPAQTQPSKLSPEAKERMRLQFRKTLDGSTPPPP